MSKRSSRGWRQVLARNPEANPQTVQSQSVRSSTMTFANRKGLVDVSRQAPETQLAQLKASCNKLLASITRAAKEGNEHKVLYLSTMLSNQRARMEAIAFKVSGTLQEPAKPMARILPDLTTDWRKYMPTSPVQQRFNQSYANHGMVYAEKPDLSSLYSEIKRPKDKAFHKIA